jgi:hypothetical protein
MHRSALQEAERAATQQLVGARFVHLEQHGLLAADVRHRGSAEHEVAIALRRAVVVEDFQHACDVDRSAAVPNGAVPAVPKARDAPW